MDIDYYMHYIWGTWGIFTACQVTIYRGYFPIGRNAIETERGGRNGLPRAHREK